MQSAKRRSKWIILIFWLFLTLTPASFGVFIYKIINGDFGALPSFEDLENPKTSIASEIYSEDNILLGKYYFENRSITSYKELSPNLINALIATEDIRFKEHSGIDIKALFRVFFVTIILRQDRGGGSTLTQQLAKKLFPRTNFNTNWQKLKRKAKEWVIAIKLERSYTKEEIITMYLNIVDFSGQSFGIKAATKEFFSTTPDSLKMEEAAILVGLLKAITRFNPIMNPDESIIRRNIVIEQMAKYEFIQVEVADSLKRLPITLNHLQEDHNTGYARYFREFLRLELKDWSKDHLKPNGEPYNIYKDGLKIYTTINSKMQQYAENAVIKHLQTIQKEFDDHWKGINIWRSDTLNILKNAIRYSTRYYNLKQQGLSHDEIIKIMSKPVYMKIFTWRGDKDTVMSSIDSIKYYKLIVQTGFMAMDTRTGHVKAWVGGPDFKHFKYDHVNINAKRQVGSTFKPFIYSLAMESGWSPCKELPDAPVIFEDYDNWSPQNAEKRFSLENYTIKRGLAHSMNSITAGIMKEFGPYAVLDIIKKVGITSEVLPVPSICLGTPDISLFELVGAYSVFSNKGIRAKPIYLSKIEDSNGNIIQEFHTEKEEALKEQTAYLMVHLLQNVVRTNTRMGSQFKLYNDIGGKTGTTQAHSDGWFIGFTPELVAGAWVGWNDRIFHFRNIRLGQGAHMALPIWAYFMQEVLNDSSTNYSKTARFTPPPNLSIELDCAKYKYKKTSFDAYF